MNPLVAPEAGASRHGTRTALSVNVNRVALLRNTRPLDIPNVVHIATLALLVQRWPQADYNIEGNPFHNLMPLVRALRPQQCTLVPDAAEQATSDHGWDLDADGARLRPLITELKQLGVRVSLFMDPLPEAMHKARKLGADRVELYTESYARAHGTPAQAERLDTYARAAEAALAAGLGLNAGHDLNRANLGDFLRTVPGVQEVSIGHALVGDALEFGMAETVRLYQRCIRLAQAPDGAAA